MQRIVLYSVLSWFDICYAYYTFRYSETGVVYPQIAVFPSIVYKETDFCQAVVCPCKA